MSDIALQVNGISKQYRLGQRERYKTLRDTLTDTLYAPLNMARALFNAKKAEGKTEPTSFWALQDVSFDVKQGEVIGIVGRNGAGKSTLLKVLSRITEPTRGHADIYGRIGSLLEVGTGFHPELTGRENIYLNGAILGMRRAEIQRKFDEIVAFSELEKFLDTPVKHYSSGMYMRLAFAVAAHLEPEILIVDEVLAVGDAMFQKKCIGKMGDVAKTGRTVLFVSHNLGAVRTLCNRGVLLNGGRVVTTGPIADVLSKYQKDSFLNSSEYSQAANTTKPMNLRRVALQDHAGKQSTEVSYADGFTLNVEYEVNKPVRLATVWIGLWTLDGVLAFGSVDYDTNPAMLDERKPGYFKTSVKIPGKLLNSGHYFVVVGISNQSPVVNYDRVEALHFSIIDETEYPIAEASNRTGILKPVLPWETELQQSV